MGEWEIGRMGEWETGRVEAGEERRKHILLYLHEINT
jgi:hypothetical protein